MEKLKRIFAREKSSEVTSGSGSEAPVQEVKETFEPGESKELEPIYVKRIALSNPGRVEEIVGELGEGNIIVSDMSQLMDEDPEGLKESVDRLREPIEEMDGQVARISETKIISTPEFVRMQLREED